MPVHDWTQIPAGIFHHFHHEWISVIAQKLNNELLPEECYSLAEQYAGAFGPDVLPLQAFGAGGESTPVRRRDEATT